MSTNKINLEHSLLSAYKKIHSLKAGSDVIKKGGAFGDARNDTELAADKILGDLLKKDLARDKTVGTIIVEGLGNFEVSEGGKLVTIDPLDGSLNYKSKGKTLGLPYSTCITVLERRYCASPPSAYHPLFGDIVAAGVIDLRNGDMWTAELSNKGKLSSRLNGNPIITAKERKLDLGKMIVIGEFYYPENREKLVTMFENEKGWLRNPGSAAYEMALVSSGQAIAYICDRQKEHELGAAYALVKGAGGVVVDWNGDDFGSKPYIFNGQTPVILAANKYIADEILKRKEKLFR